MLQEEIDSARRAVRTDAYQLSIGEIVSMYKAGEFVINPDFQRLFRWELGQKAKLIESLLLGIPLPSIFVFEKEDSTWELIDGLQRISTLLEFMGELKDPETKEHLPPIALIATKYLPSLNNVVWEVSEEVEEVPTAEQQSLLPEQKLAIRRSRLSVEILKRPSDNATKYDLFQRLNAGGTAANAQELRNCIVIMVRKSYAAFMRELAASADFLAVLSPTEEQMEKQKHMEYVSRFLVHTFVDYDGKLDVEEFINEGIVTLAEENKTARARKAFEGTFELLSKAYGGDALRRFQNGSSTGRVGLAAFEGIAVGIARNIVAIQKKSDPVAYVKVGIEKFWKSPDIKDFFASGLRGTVRIQRTIPFGEHWFAQ